jgi:hypothetical protein
MFIAHRVNTIAELLDTPSYMGVEVDLRDAGNEIIISHDPFSMGENFENYLENYTHRFLIANIKSERIELRVKDLLDRFEIKDYFFLDSSAPMIVKYGSQSGFQFSLRVSEYESIESALKMKVFADWIWVDCFERLSIDQNEYLALKKAGFKLCIVSPELHDSSRNVMDFIDNLKKLKIVPNMVCSKYKNYDIWNTNLLESSCKFISR